MFTADESRHSLAIVQNMTDETTEQESECLNN